MKKRVAAMLLAGLMVFGLFGCGGQEDTPPEPEKEEIVQPEPAPEPEPEPEPDVYVPAGTNPLTGLPMEPEYENNRPVAVMFNNMKISQPQLGVAQADIIYEIPAEGGITRMLGIFQSLEGVGNLGSIRSTRPYYLEAVLAHDALLVHAGASPEAYQNIPEWGVHCLDGIKGGSMLDVFWRDAERRKNAGYEHSLLTSGEKVLAYLAKGRYPTQHEDGYIYEQPFAEDGTPVGGARAEQIELKYSPYKTGVFTYDVTNRQYRVSQYGKEYIDGNTGDQISVTNLLVLETDMTLIPGDTEARMRVRMTGSGEGTYFCGGKSVPILWSREDRNSQFVYTLEDGTPLIMERGASYVCIMDPNDSRLKIQ